jgi:hypothetical protein
VSYQPADTALDAVVWHFDPSSKAWCGCPRYHAYLGEWKLTAYERGEWQVSNGSMPRAQHMESSLDRAQRRAFLAYQALTQEL